MANGERGPDKKYPATIYARMLPEQREFVLDVGDGNLSEGIRILIDFARANRPDLDAYRERRRPPGRPPKE